MGCWSCCAVLALALAGIAAWAGVSLDKITLLLNKRDSIGKYDSRFASTALNDDVSGSDQEATNEYYDLATDFYEYGWGSSFHFAIRVRGESLSASILRHEHWLALKLGLKRGDQVGDLGMGVGGPARRIARFSGATITGVTINQYQVKRANRLAMVESTAEERSRIRYIQGDYTNLASIPSGSLDAVYYIESSCHVANRTVVFSEAMRVLKSGGRLFSYEWTMTDRFDKTNQTHLKIKRDIEHGDGINNLIPTSLMLEQLQATGLELLEHGDLVEDAIRDYGEENVPWYEPLQAGWSIQQFPQSALGRTVTTTLVTILDAVGITEGALATQTMLLDAADGLVIGGIDRIFTPMYYVLARKP